MGSKPRRRDFLKATAGLPAFQIATAQRAVESGSPVYRGLQRSQISFPLGGIGTGCIGLGGRGELRDWEIFNRPDKGNTPAYAFGALWVQPHNGPPVTRVLESKFVPPYD